ncbi:carbohydrate ABC transporter permease [Marinilactibacillus sp. Marseille-P9653]|uniref:carbohydrate ABC transporter permease n=1 Tax=Marinilactibacillus sp. Marseille-P9653 TaxID=2866583 RepID=UPI001CE48FE6|nr:carbohydrate ABC transporter permease [Marinilactibacillus sp. Marseille-P9653]
MAVHIEESTQPFVLDKEQLALIKKQEMKQNLTKFMLLGINIILVSIVLFPLLYAVTMSLKSPSEVYRSTFQFLPETWQFSNYRDAFNVAPLGRYIFNSFVVALAITGGQLVSGALAAFSFEFLDSKGKEVMFALVLATLMVPGEATIVSNYLQISQWGWLDSFPALIVPFLTSATTIFLFRQFFKSFPIALYESAKIDGCSNLRFIFQILLPLSKPAIGAVSVNAFINAWNMYMWPLLVSGSDKYRTVQIGVSMMNSVDSESIVLMLAGVVIVLIPSLLIFVVGQKSLVKGLFSGSVKG